MAAWPTSLKNSVAAVLASDYLTHRHQTCDVRSAFVSVPANTTDQALITAVAGRRLLVVLFRLHAGAVAGAYTFNSKGAGAGVAITEQFACGANGGRADGFSPVGHFVTATGEGLTVTSVGGVGGVGVRYIEIEPA